LWAKRRKNDGCWVFFPLWKKGEKRGGKEEGKKTQHFAHSKGRGGGSKGLHFALTLSMHHLQKRKGNPYLLTFMLPGVGGGGKKKKGGEEKNFGATIRKGARFSWPDGEKKKDAEPGGSTLLYVTSGTERGERGSTVLTQNAFLDRG